MLRIQAAGTAGGGPAARKRGGVDLLLPVTLFSWRMKCYQKNKKIKNGISWSKQMTGAYECCGRLGWYLAGIGSPGSASPDGK